jgi:hypothetical protein
MFLLQLDRPARMGRHNAWDDSRGGGRKSLRRFVPFRHHDLDGDRQFLADWTDPAGDDVDDGRVSPLCETAGPPRHT